MEFSFDNQNTSPNKDAIASERLRKAIERNRAKQAKRKGHSISPSSSFPDNSWTPPGGGSTRPSRSSRVGGARTQVARPETVEFSTPLRKAPKKTDALVTYPTKKVRRSPRRRVAKSAVHDYVIRGIWVFCGILGLRLIFADGGVVEYYSKKETLQSRVNQVASAEKENQSLVSEIEKIRKDARYQKKIVREHLGFIAADEYLILFPKEKAQTSI